MRNADTWAPTKYEVRRGRLRASADVRHVAVGSRLAADLNAVCFAKHLPERTRGRLLDLGCGAAPLFGVYRDYASSVVTLDWAQSLHADRHVDVRHDLNEPLPFSDASFETVILSDVLEHVREPALLCREIGRVLSAGGHLIGGVPFLYGIHEAPHDFFRYTEFGLRELFLDAGLRIELLDPMGGSLEVLVDLMAKHLAQIGAPGRILATSLQSAAIRFGNTAAGHRLARKSSSRFTLGYFFVASRAT